MRFKETSHSTHLSRLAGMLVAAGMSMTATAEISNTIIGTDQNAVFGNNENIRHILSGNRGSNGGGDQSQQGSDALVGTPAADLMIGALGIDVLAGYDGNDIMIGGTEDFNPFNRDRAFGGNGDDVFLWAPGDGNDFFNGGDGLDVVMLGLIGEELNTEGLDERVAPIFSVNLPSGEGSQDFDGIFINPLTGLPIMDVAGGPGFCEVVDGSGNAEEQIELDALGLDHLIRFVLRGPAADTSNPDTGLRIALHIKNTEILICGGTNPGEIVALDLTTSPPTPIFDGSQLPPAALNMIRIPAQPERLR